MVEIVVEFYVKTFYIFKWGDKLWDETRSMYLNSSKRQILPAVNNDPVCNMFSQGSDITDDRSVVAYLLPPKNWIINLQMIVGRMTAASK